MNNLEKVIYNELYFYDIDVQNVMIREEVVTVSLGDLDVNVYTVKSIIDRICERFGYTPTGYMLDI